MKKIRILGLCICCALLIFSAVEITLAYPNEPTVSYNGKEKEFVFVNTEETDLFRDFKDVVPGDIFSQEIVLRGEKIENATDFYLRAEVNDGVTIPETVTLKVYLEENLISDSPLNSSGSLEENVHLCQLTKDGSVKLNAVLEVPTSVGNEISDMKKEVHWIFTAQEMGEADQITSDTTVKTGDDTHLLVYMIINILSLAIIIFIIFTWKKGAVG